MDPSSPKTGWGDLQSEVLYKSCLVVDQCKDLDLSLT